VEARADLSEILRFVSVHKAEILWDPKVREVFERNGIATTPAGFYYPVPTAEEIERSFEYRDPQVFDDARLREWLERLVPYAREFDPPDEEDAGHPDRYAWNAKYFGFSDAIAYYCMLRLLRPRRVVEVGSGFSTLVALEALERNGGGEIICIEPYPPDFLAERAIRLVTAPVQSLPAWWFDSTLRDGDVLFIDSTHAVKTGSDCVYLYLQVLPQLGRSVTVHVHDIFLPAAMPKEWLSTHRLFWGEPYLVYAFLLGNERARVVYGSTVNAARNRDLMERMTAGKTLIGGGSLWFELDAAAPATRSS
jgi:Methyltransferase domain